MVIDGCAIDHPALRNVIEKNAGLLGLKFLPRASDKCVGIVELCYGHTTRSMVCAFKVIIGEFRIFSC